MTETRWFYEHYRDASAIGVNTTRLLHTERSPFQKIDVYETVAHGRLLTLDDMVMLTERDEFVYHDLLTHVPLCVHPEPKRVLIVGGGDGGCIREALKHPSVTEVVLCEIDERVTRVCEAHIPSVASHVADPKVVLEFRDGIEYVAAEAGRHDGGFDAILVDSSEPVGPAAALFTDNFYASLAAALRPGGVVSLQAESPFYAPDVVTELFSAMRGPFSQVHGYYGLIPTYPSGAWTFCLASQDRSPRDVDLDRAAQLDARYYSAELATGAFALPRFIADLVGGSGTTQAP